MSTESCPLLKMGESAEVTVNIDDDFESSTAAALNTARKAFSSGKTLPISFRRTQLQNMLKMIDENKEQIINALQMDLRKDRVECEISELGVLRIELNTLLRNLKRYTGRDYVPLNLGLPFDRAFTQHDPFGVVLVIGAWNFPFMLTLQPVCGAIASGNCVIIKPSELAPNSAKLMVAMVTAYLDKSCYHVIEGDVEQTKSLLRNKFDYIFATGSTNVGKAVMAAAAVHLTPTTLELGGKSPVYIDDSCQASIKTVAKRILWGKTYNLGQICVGPDYLLCSKSIEDAFIKEAKAMLKEWYGEDIKSSPHLSRIINERHFQRLKKLLESTQGTVAFGGQMDETDKWIAPTIVSDVTLEDELMKDEIFGPILPIVRMDNPDSAIALINSRPKPLALYVFSKRNDVIQSFIKKTSSGGVCVNDTTLHCIRDKLPFGGVGDSGIGNYHGKYTFETFSHKKAVLWRPLTRLDDEYMALSFRYPPFNNPMLVRVMKFGARFFHMLNVNLRVLCTFGLAALCIVIGAIFMYLLFYYGVISV